MYHNAADALTVLQCISAGEEDFPDTIIQLLHGMASAVPEVKVAGEVHGFGSGSPLPVVPAVVGTVEAVEHMAVGKFPKGLAFLQNALSGVFEVRHPQLQVALKGLQHGIIFQNFQAHKVSVLSKYEWVFMGRFMLLFYCEKPYSSSMIQSCSETLRIFNICCGRRKK